LTENRPTILHPIALYFYYSGEKQVCISVIVITIDIEWAPDHVLADTLQLLDEYNISATLFSTHNDGKKTTDHERALHPNFLKEKEESDILADLNSLYPNAKGLRSHGMFVYTNLRNSYPEFGIEYESNYMQYRVSDLEPFWMPDGTLQFPVYWMDDQWLSLRDSALPDISNLMSGRGLKIFDFHPPHVCYNTPSHDYYENHKEEYFEASTSVDQMRAKEDGVRDIFVKILEYIEENKEETATLGELNKKRASQSPFKGSANQ
jgi:hypothetical protein